MTDVSLPAVRYWAYFQLKYLHFTGAGSSVGKGGGGGGGSQRSKCVSVVSFVFRTTWSSDGRIFSSRVSFLC